VRHLCPHLRRPPEGADLGVKRQEKDIRAMIARIDPGAVVVEVYVDNDLSA
jgi:hypothetical protein